MIFKRVRVMLVKLSIHMRVFSILSIVTLSLINTKEFFKLKINNERKTIIKKERTHGEEKEK